MEFLLIYSVFLIIVLTPSLQIFRSRAIAGWTKTAWVVGSAISVFIPAMLVSICLVIAIKFLNYEITAKGLLFGPEAIIFWIANILSFSLPWIVYSKFKSTINKKTALIWNSNTAL